MLLIALWFICFKIKITLSQEHLFWTFSTVMQSFVALGALLGMVAVFKLQVTDNKIDSLALALRSLMHDFPERIAGLFSSEDVLNEAKEHSRSSTSLQPGIEHLEEFLEEKRKIKKQIIDFVKKIVVVTTFALVFLILTPLIIKTSAGVASLGIILYLAIPSLIATIRLIKEIL